MYTIISISIAWQQMYQANQVLTTFADITMTTPQYVLFTHVSIEDIFNTNICIIFSSLILHSLILHGFIFLSCTIYNYNLLLLNLIYIHKACYSDFGQLKRCNMSCMYYKCI